MKDLIDYKRKDNSEYKRRHWREWGPSELGRSEVVCQFSEPFMTVAEEGRLSVLRRFYEQLLYNIII